MGKNKTNPSRIVRQADRLVGQGKRDEAARLYKAVLATHPQHFDALHSLGRLQYQRGQFAEADALVSAAVKARPGNAGALWLLGLAQAASGRPDQALASYDASLAAQPEVPEVLNSRGLALLNLGRPAEAVAVYDNAVDLRPDYAEALNNRGVAFLDLKRPEDALASCDRALASRPDYVDALNNRGIALSDLGRPAEALVCLDGALALKQDYAEACNNRGNALKILGRAAEALASYERALAIRTDYPQAVENIGILLAELGRLDEATDAIEAAIALAPTRARSYYLLSDVRRLVPGEPHLLAMQNLALDMAALGPDEQIDLHFALGKALADIGDRAGSFQHLIEGNALKRAQTDYDEAAVLRTLEDMPAAFTEELVGAAAGLGDPSEVPIFIVGMPRSGTTLVEQILASLPDVFGAGETADFSKSVAELNAEPVDAAASPQDAELIWCRRLQRIGKTYVDRLRARAPTAHWIIDKTLENYRAMGLIHLALPNARIIHMRRDPVDTCISCFSKLFTDVPYTYDLGELGRHYRAYETLMAHWRKVLPEEVLLDVQYEDVVADLEGQARRILAHCGLTWDPRCLDFHLTERRVSTASWTQVRQPIYKSAIGRSKAYEAFLKPLLTALDGADARGSA
jgi:tetratricopeptide (TPR) repeat protein